MLNILHHLSVEYMNVYILHARILEFASFASLLYPFFFVCKTKLIVN